MQCQPFNEALAAALAGGNRIAMLILLDESSRSNRSHDRFAQIAAELVPGTLLPATIARVPLLEEGRLIAGLLELYFSQLHVSTKVH
jgi:hypothetical protein